MRAIREAANSWRRAPLLGVLGVATIAFSLFSLGLFGLVAVNIRQALAEAAPASYDLVLLDVDNGPRYLVHEQNAALYRPDFLSTAVAALRPGGALVVWSADEAPELEAALVEAAGNAEARAFDVRLQERDEQYWLYLARR